MKKSIQVLLIAIILAGCSSFPNLPRLASQTSPPPLDTSTPFISETPIPTQNLFATSTPTPLTFTPTVTALGAELFTPTSSETSFPTDFPTPDIPLDPEDSGYFTPQNTGFLGILISNNTMYWNEGPCSPREIKVSAFVEDQINTHHVLLFTRLREKKNTLNVTKWNAGAMSKGNGSFNYDVRTLTSGASYFVDAWLEYQLGVNEDRDVIGRRRFMIGTFHCDVVP
jgi:hypothetical protein